MLKEKQEEGLLLSEIKSLEEAGGSYEWLVWQAAQLYINLGWYVIPIRQGEKKALAPRYQAGYAQASRNKKVIDKWFEPDTGQFAGFNIGIATGRTGGVFVVDVDRSGPTGADGAVVLDKLEEEHGKLPDCPAQVTPSGGFHYFFEWQENLKCSAGGKVGPSIDTRGGTDTACQGHVVAWPSIVDGKQYEWTDGGPLPQTPKWIVDKMGVPWSPNARGTGRGNENVQAEDYERPIEKFQIVNMLKFIDPDSISYDEWLRVGLSIKSQLPDQDGLVIWDEWSFQGKRYKENECYQRWEGFSDYGTVRGGTLFYLAKEHGWSPDTTQGERSGNPLDEVVAELNGKYAIVTVGGKIKILREKTISRPTDLHFELMDKESFNLLLSNRFIMSGGEKPKRVPISQIWLSHQARRTYENGMGLFPDEEVPDGWYNTWNGFSVQPSKGECPLFLAHIKDVICSGNNSWYEWVLDWLADLVQEPNDPKGCAIVMRGGEGVGKGTLANAIGRIFGPHYRHLIDDAHLLSNFNSHLFDAVFVFADEITWGGNKKTAGKLKGMVTERDLVGERKGVDAISYRNLVHLIIASNSEWVIPAGVDSRRWFVLDVPSSRVGNRKYFNSVQDELDNGGIEAFLYFLLKRKITNNLRHAPVTEALRAQRLLTSQDDTVLTWLVYTVTKGSLISPDLENPDVSWPESVLKTDLHDEYAQYCSDRKIKQHGVSVFSKELRKYKIMSLRKRVGRERKYAFTIPPINELQGHIEDKYPTIFEDE